MCKLQGIMFHVFGWSLHFVQLFPCNLVREARKEKTNKEEKKKVLLYFISQIYVTPLKIYEFSLGSLTSRSSLDFYHHEELIQGLSDRLPIAVHPLE